MITSLAKDKVGSVESVSLLGHVGLLDFTQDGQGLRIKLPTDRAGSTPWCFKITGLKLKP